MADTSNQDKLKEKLAAILDKFKTDPEKAAEQFLSLEKKLGEQGQELGEARKKYEQVAAQTQQFQAWVQQNQPIVDYWQKNGPAINAMIQEQQRQRQGIQANAAAAARKTPGYSILTDDEQEALTQRIAAHLQQQALAPWTQNFAQTAEQVLNQRLQAQNQAWEQRLRAHNDVMWRTFEHLVPAEKLESARKFQERAMEYADPSKLNPMQLANDSISMHAKLAQAEQRARELEDKLAQRERESVQSFGSGSLFAASDNGKDTAPANRDDRMKAVFSEVQEAHGQDGMAALFGR